MLEDLEARLMRFALVLTGDPALAGQLTRAVTQQMPAPQGRGSLATETLIPAFAQIHKLFRREDGRGSGESGMFSRTGLAAASRLGVSPEMALYFGEMSPLQRGVLLMVHGEELSYQVTAEIFDLPVDQLMSLLAQARARLVDNDDDDPAPGDNPLAGAGKAQESLTQRR